MRPRSARQVAVVGGGMVGLCVAWFLQERGVEVTVVERDRITPGPTWGGAGASWGSAGWLSPGLATPLPEPAVLRYGLRMLLRPDSPVYVPPVADLTLARFLAGFVRNATIGRWRVAMTALSGLTSRALDAFDVLAAGGVPARTHSAAPFLACYTNPADRDALLAELAEIRECGQPVHAVEGDAARAHELVPILSDSVRYAVRLYGQRFCDPGRFVAALAGAVRERGGVIQENTRVDEVIDAGSHVRLVTSGLAAGGADSREFGAEGSEAGESDAGEQAGAGRGEGRYDAVVLANGAWLSRLARRFGVRAPVQAGRGYSFLVPVKEQPSGPVYFPAARVACTPLDHGLRVAGMMEFRAPDARPDRRRFDAIVAAARGLLRGVDLDSRTQEWVGPRPCTPDGLPLIGRTATRRVFVAGGHGMWGITLGPVTGQLLAEAVVDGVIPPELRPFDPLR